LRQSVDDTDKFAKAVNAFDAYNANDPVSESENGIVIAKELLYAKRMTKKLLDYQPGANECLQLAARSQHIGRWEIARSTYPMDKKGYFQWRNELKKHHASVAFRILQDCDYDQDRIGKVCSLLLKDSENPDTQVLEDVICLVFLAFYVDEFASKYQDSKVVDILRKTIKKMSSQALNAVEQIPLSEKIKMLINEAVRG
jgi:hypothetical protein